MNLVEESFQKKDENSSNKTSKIILISIFVVLAIIIGIFSYLMYIQSGELQIYVNGSKNNNLKDVISIQEDGTVYAQIKEIASYLGYSSYNGEYSEKSEEANKCYVESENKEEIANFKLGSNKIYKLDLTEDTQNYEYEYSKETVKANGGKLYATSEAIEKAFNVSFQYDKKQNKITIYTMPYLIEVYSKKVLDYGYKEISDVFSNKKTVLKDMLVVKKEDGSMGVIDINGKNVLDSKYSDIVYLSSIGDFIVQSDEKYGVVSEKGTTKIRLLYDSIELIDKDAGLYLVEQDKKYGVLDLSGKSVIDIDNDEIGMDISKFQKNDIKNKYLLADNLIPVRQDKLWGLYDKSGNKIYDYEYDNFGYIATNNKNVINLLLIPDYDVLVACKNKKYTLLSSYGKELFAAPVADDIYMTIQGNEKQYKILANNNLYDAIEFLKSQGVSTKNSQNNSSKSSSKDDAEESNMDSEDNE